MGGYQSIKRGFDVLGALATLIVLAPVIVGIGILVFLFLGSPIFFTQERVTRGERVFRLWKFRTMRNADPARGLVSDGQRLTRFGRLLRSSSLDELPSLWNVVRGDMSLIGPRPLPACYLPHYSAQQRRRHQVRGGLSGLAQVGGRNRVHWDDRFDLDVEYVDSMSFRLDLQIVLRTVGTVFRADGISQDGEATATSFGGSLRSDLLVFDQCARTEFATTWAVSSPAGDAIGTCEMSVISENALLIGFDCSDGQGWGIDIRREALKLLTNRARATEADFAVCAVPADSPNRSALAEIGYHEVSDTDERRRFGYSMNADMIVAACRLWPAESLGHDWVRSSILPGYGRDAVSGTVLTASEHPDMDSDR